MTASTVRDLRRFALASTFFRPTTLPSALRRLGFVQADPIRAPARAQDLTLRHRVRDYRAGDLERRYPTLAIEEDFLVNYGFVTRELQSLMHPRRPREAWSAARWRQAAAVLDFVRERRVVHPADVDAHFAHGRSRNWFGGSSRASTELLDDMHYRGLLRVARREGGIRLYAASDRAAPLLAASGRRVAVDPGVDPQAAFDRLLDVVIAKYAPLPSATLGQLASHLLGGVPQWHADRAAALERARARCARARLDGVDWFWPAVESPRLRDAEVPEVVRLLAPFDPLVWDRRRFEAFWGWAYRFEAYTPAPRRRLGYYALPLLWRDEVIGWANATHADGRLAVAPGFVAGRAPRGAGFRREYEAEVERLREFLGTRPGTRTARAAVTERS
jgi:hypothetical protein